MNGDRLTCREAWEAQHAILWAPHEWPRGSLLAISGPATGWAASYVDIDDVDGVWDLVERVHRRTDVYVRVCPVGGAARARGRGRGIAADSLATACLWLDIDTADGQHKTGRPLPSMREAGYAVRALIEPSLVVRTGGGVHIYVALPQPVTLRTDEDGDEPRGRDLLERWAARWSTEFTTRGWHLDVGAARDRARVLRVAGTLNAKTAPPREGSVHTADPLAVMSRAEVEALCPPLVGRESREGRAAVTTAVRQAGGKGAAWCRRAVGVTDLMRETWGMRESSPGRWRMPRPDGSFGGDEHAQVWTVTPEQGGEIEVVTAFGSRLQGEWRQPDEQHSLTSWDLVVIALGGNVDLALALVEAHRTARDAAGIPAQAARALAARRAGGAA